jgi:predicted dehydrogenase
MKRHIPRLGFLGTGWIGRHRLEAVKRSGEAEVFAISDICDENAAEAIKVAPGAKRVKDLDELLRLDLDGVVIATPSACHCRQAIRSLQAGKAVFCQKPLARTRHETEEVVAAARQANRLLGVDFSYRHTDGMDKINRLIRDGGMGDVYAADLMFHNAYGPDKPWFYDPAQAGGGCLMDLGSHLVDLALWNLGFPEVTSVTSSIFAKGEPLGRNFDRVEDYAVASITVDTGAIIRIACSWNLPAGQDAVIEHSFFGTGGGARFRNVNGSFFDFTAERFQGTARETLSSPPEAWGGKAILSWVRQLRDGLGFDPSAESLVTVASVLDAAYGRR